LNILIRYLGSFAGRLALGGIAAIIERLAARTASARASSKTSRTDPRPTLPSTSRTEAAPRDELGGGS
jgi:hypothetical protein